MIRTCIITPTAYGQPINNDFTCDYRNVLEIEFEFQENYERCFKKTYKIEFTGIEEMNEGILLLKIKSQLGYPKIDVYFPSNFSRTELPDMDEIKVNDPNKILDWLFERCKGAKQLLQLENQLT